MKKLVLSSILITSSLIFSYSYAEAPLTQENAGAKLIEETADQNANVVNEEPKVQAAGTVAVTPTKSECQEKQIQNISISNSSIQSNDTDFNQIAESTLNSISEIAQALALKDFNLIMTDQYASRNGYSMTTYDYNASFSMTFEADKRAFGAFLKQLSPISISSSVTQQTCGE
jgi:hypothetical protein